MEQAGEGTQIVPVTWNELHTLNDTTGAVAYYAPSPHKSLPSTSLFRCTYAAGR